MSAAAPVLTAGLGLSRLERIDARLRQLDAALQNGFRRLRTRCSVAGRLDPAALDAAQVPSYELAVAAAELAAARALLDHARKVGALDELAIDVAAVFAGEVMGTVSQRLSARALDLDLPASDLLALHPAQDPALAMLLSEHMLEGVGAKLVERDGRLPPSGLDTEQELMRDSFGQFARQVVAPRAQRIHREDLDVPEEIIRGAAALGLFGVCIPQRFGGLQPDERPDTIAMLVVTEALSAASLGAAGSLITRPEIMARALLAGGTEAQKSHWLPKLASGERLAAISITEPDFGSDVAHLKLRAERVAGGWRLSGSKSWCTFAGRAEVILVAARTNPDPALGHRGLSLFMVEKPRFPGHAFEHCSPRGGRLSGRAIRTIGYRGMHSFDLFFEEFVVPDEALVGGADGEGRGFYLAMAGLVGGRVQTAARACGVMQAAFDAGLSYARSRKVFGRSVSDYGLTRARLARIAAWLCASRQLAYAVARQLDASADEMSASLVKLFACRAAEWVTRDVMQLFGGMGYAEETEAGRYFVDARVLSIFEGAEETLALKVIARELIARG